MIKKKQMFRPSSYPEKQFPKMLVVSDLPSWLGSSSRQDTKETHRHLSHTSTGTRRRNQVKVKGNQAKASILTGEMASSRKTLVSVRLQWNILRSLRTTSRTQVTLKEQGPYICQDKASLLSKSFRFKYNLNLESPTKAPPPRVFKGPLNV